jgi:hypothetical protein
VSEDRARLRLQLEPYGRAVRTFETGNRRPSKDAQERAALGQVAVGRYLGLPYPNRGRVVLRGPDAQAGCVDRHRISGRGGPRYPDVLAARCTWSEPPCQPDPEVEWTMVRPSADKSGRGKLHDRAGPAAARRGQQKTLTDASYTTYGYDDDSQLNSSLGYTSGGAPREILRSDRGPARPTTSGSASPCHLSTAISRGEPIAAQQLGFGYDSGWNVHPVRWRHKGVVKGSVLHLATFFLQHVTGGLPCCAWLEHFGFNIPGRSIML